MKKHYLIFAITALILLTVSSGFAQDGHGKNMGIAVNPVLAMFEWGSGEINFWNIDRNAEINIPVQYMNNPFFLEDDDSEIRYVSLGFYYRRFLNEKQKGFYIQAGWKHDYARVTDELGTSTGSINSLLFGFGYRVIAKNGLFWGVGISAGRAWGNIKDTSGETIRGTGLAFDIDLFKFGFAW